MSELRIQGLRAAVEGQEILRGVDLTVRSGEVHAVMGPNGSGKSTLAHVIMGRPGYEVLDGSVTLDGVELLGRPPWERAQAGLFLAHQYPIEVPGVPLDEVLAEALAARVRLGLGAGDGIGTTVDDDGHGLHDQLASVAAEIGLDVALLKRPMNVDLSGGEKKRNETLQMVVLRPKFAFLDEIDSGLDIDGLRQVSRRIERATHDVDLGVLAITHYARLLNELLPDVVHVLRRGRIVDTGGPELAQRLDQTGYAAYGDDELESAGTTSSKPSRPVIDDPFVDPLGL
jgi:Fe-S cluster assembly ATP-binding protein